MRVMEDSEESWNAQSQSHNVVLIQEFHHFEQCADFVLKKDGELPHLRATKFFGGRRRHSLVQHPFLSCHYL